MRLSLSGPEQELEIGTERDPDTGVAVLRFRGDLTTSKINRVYAAVGKAAAECPAAVLLDLSALRRADAASVSVFYTLAHQARQTWGVPVLLCAAGPGIVRDLGAMRGSMALYDRAADALLAVRAGVPRWACERFGPEPTSVSAARRLVAESCAAWGWSDLTERACMIASELATNAIRHTGAEYEVMVSGTEVFLRVAVRDNSPAMPRLIERPGTSGAIVPAGNGRGLRIVAGLATLWGGTGIPGGKIVWALLRSSPEARPRPPGR
ncbi:STAS domain-containing protein [Actinoplanes sp. DH11]|uniref:STAS domain-containing protein n=1 Tax=Actinoplanes sp. DH11 TaxID=2857011 RepID=UPI001E416EC8|nr:STAS domain-containing protein [Actinoplanes sp. DH11]